MARPAETQAPTGVKLDGNYSGVADSAPFSAEITLKDYADGNSWEPTLTY